MSDVRVRRFLGTLYEGGAFEDALKVEFIVNVLAGCVEDDAPVALETLASFVPSLGALDPAEALTRVKALLRGGAPGGGALRQERSASAASSTAAGAASSPIPLPSQPAWAEALSEAEAAAVATLRELCPRASESAALYILREPAAGSLERAALLLLDPLRAEPLLAEARAVAARQAEAADAPARAARDAASEARARERVLARFDRCEVEVTSRFGAYTESVAPGDGGRAGVTAAAAALGPLPALGAAGASAGRKQLFYNNQPVSAKQLEELLSKKKPEWDGGSRGKVKTKRKGGKGFV